MARLNITRRDALDRRAAWRSPALAVMHAQASGREHAGQMETAIRNVIGEAEVRKGKVTLDLPPLVENGNTVPMTVSVECPMTQEDYVKAIHVFNEKNPQPNVISVAARARAPARRRVDAHPPRRTRRSSPRSPRCPTARYWSDTQEVIVTLAACLEDLI